MQMTPITRCNVQDCSYNQQSACHTPAITVGAHAECNTFNHSNPEKCGFPDVKGGIGACQAADCRFNQMLECQAQQIDVSLHNYHADCHTYQPK